MKQSIALGANTITYDLKRSERARLMRLEIRRDGLVTVTAPVWMQQAFINRFIASKSHWIDRNLKHVNSLKGKIFLDTSRAEYLEYKENARILAENRLAHYNKLYNFRINRLSIKNNRKRWGSCSKRGNLNLNYKIALLPLELADYVIVHELCHLGQLNHSKKFWELVSLALPNYKELKSKFGV